MPHLNVNIIGLKFGWYYRDFERVQHAYEMRDSMFRKLMWKLHL